MTKRDRPGLPEVRSAASDVIRIIGVVSSEVSFGAKSVAARPKSPILMQFS